MDLLDFFMMKKKKTYSDEDIKKEFEKNRRKMQLENNSSFNRAIKLHAERECSPQKGDDLLAKKAEFMRIYSFIARTNRYYHSLNYKKGKFNSNPLWCQEWHDYEQAERLKAQKRWRELTSRTR